MRVVVVGATGMVGRQILSGLVDHKAIDKVISLSDTGFTPDGAASAESGIERRSVNLRDDLSEQFRFSDAIVYAGWPIGAPERSPSASRHLEVLANVCASVARADVKTFVYGSSAGAYSEAPPGVSVDENWPTASTPSSPTSLQIAQGEKLVDEFEANHQIIRVVVLRPALIVSPSKTPKGWRERLGKRVVGGIVAGRRVRFVPDLGSDGIQVLHVADLVEAFRLAVTASVVGRFNLTADPISSDMLAEVFRAKEVRVALDPVLMVHSYAGRIGLASLDPDTLRVSLQTPALSTWRAQSELGWSVKHPGASVLEEWARSFVSTDRNEVQAQAGVEMDASIDPVPAVDYRFLYERSLNFFGQRVHAIRADQWTDMTEYQGWNVWQLVAVVAREQYRTALRLRGEHDEEIERKLPEDPLGINRADGWDLAAERGMSAWTEGQAVGPVVARVVPDVICDITERAWCLARAIGFDGAADPALTRFVEGRMSPPAGE